MYITKNVFTPPVNTAIIIFFMKPVFIKSKYEWIDSTHTLITKSYSFYEASVCIGVFLKVKTLSQYKGSSIVALSNSPRGGNWHLLCASPNSRIAAWTISFLILF